MAEETSQHPSGESQKSYVVPGAILIAAILIAGALIYSNRTGTRNTGQDTAVGNATPKSPPNLYAASDPTLGNPDAPVTIVEFSDFQCPYCERFFKEAEPQIIEQYVKTGKAKFIYRDFAFLGQESKDAAAVAECANAQGKFWQYHDYLFRHQNGENQGAFTPANLKQFARITGLDVTPFDSCLDSKTYTQEVIEDTSEGKRLGVSGTPTTFVNGEMMVGALPFSEYQAAIEKALTGAK